MAKNYQNDRENYIKACVKKEETLYTVSDRERHSFMLVLPQLETVYRFQKDTAI